MDEDWEMEDGKEKMPDLEDLEKNRVSMPCSNWSKFKGHLPY